MPRNPLMQRKDSPMTLSGTVEYLEPAIVGHAFSRANRGLILPECAVGRSSLPHSDGFSTAVASTGVAQQGPDLDEPRAADYDPGLGREGHRFLPGPAQGK